MLTYLCINKEVLREKRIFYKSFCEINIYKELFLEKEENICQNYQ